MLYFKYFNIDFKFISKEKDLNQNHRRTRSVRNYPAHTFEEALNLAEYIQKHGTSGALARISLANHLNMSPKSSSFTTLLSAGEQYKITSGRYNDDSIALSELGISILSPRSQSEQTHALQQALYAPAKFQELKLIENTSGSIDDQYIASVVIRDLSIHPDLAEEYIAIYKENKHYFEKTLLRNTLSPQELINITDDYHIQRKPTEEPETREPKKAQTAEKKILLITPGSQESEANNIQILFRDLNLNLETIEDLNFETLDANLRDTAGINRVIIQLPFIENKLNAYDLGLTVGLGYGVSGLPPIITIPIKGSQNNIGHVVDNVTVIKYQDFNDMAIQLLLELHQSGAIQISLS